MINEPPLAVNYQENILLSEYTSQPPNREQENLIEYFESSEEEMENIDSDEMNENIEIFSLPPSISISSRRSFSDSSYILNTHSSANFLNTSLQNASFSENWSSTSQFQLPDSEIRLQRRIHFSELLTTFKIDLHHNRINLQYQLKRIFKYDIFFYKIYFVILLKNLDKLFITAGLLLQVYYNQPFYIFLPIFFSDFTHAICIFQRRLGAFDINYNYKKKEWVSFFTNFAAGIFLLLALFTKIPYLVGISAGLYSVLFGMRKWEPRVEQVHATSVKKN